MDHAVHSGGIGIVHARPVQGRHRRREHVCLGSGVDDRSVVVFPEYDLLGCDRRGDGCR
ncbi:hypothetical protein D1872_295220 [compost metagenome]